LFVQQLSPESIKAKVMRRVNEYGGEKDRWFEEWFLPTMAAMKIQSLAWEDLAATAGPEYLDYYVRCIEFNKSIFSRLQVSV